VTYRGASQAAGGPIQATVGPRRSLPVPLNNCKRAVAVVAVEGAPRWLRLAVSMQPTRQSGPRQSLHLATGAPFRAATPVWLAALKLPEFTQEARDRNDRTLRYRIRVAMRIVDGRRWQAGCLSRVRANRSERPGGTGPPENKHKISRRRGFGGQRQSPSQCSVIVTTGK
jgi:hypothetical protein